MKTAISIPGALHKSADVLARRLGLSRSALYATAVAEFVAKHQGKQVTERLNAVYATESGRMDPGLMQLQARVLRRSEW
jgi:metal-responsive CopG/Arc/MetJ family transcriptional regulator